MFPLATLPVANVPSDLNSADPRTALRHVNTLMKNDLLRALNAIQSNGAHTLPGQPSFPAFLDYASRVCGVLELHLEGDQKFFTTKDPRVGGRSLFEVFGYTDTGYMPIAIAGVQALKEKIEGWKLNPAPYSPAVLTHEMAFAGPMVNGMKQHVAAIKEDALQAATSKEALVEMVEENLKWFTGQYTAEFLLPFVVAHHDLATTDAWPPIPAEAREALPELVKEHQDLWQFAPFHPLTGAKRA
ncbi:hypothetical protein GGF50DRAFT_118929 [Schizophyllum commune]